MKVIHAIYDSVDNPWLGGGGATRTHEIYKRITNNNNITVITGNFTNASAKIDGVKYVRVGIGSNYTISRLSYHLLAPFYMLFMKADISVEDMGMPIPFFTTKLKKRYLCSVQFIPKMSYVKKRGFLGKVLIKVFELGIKFYTNFTTVSEYAKKEIVNLNTNAKVSVLLNGINIPAELKPEKKYILYLGRIDINQKGIDTLILAMSHLKAQGYHMPLVIAGGGEKNEVESMKKLIDMHDLDKLVSYVGAVHAEEKTKILEKAAFVVFPSRNETFGIVAIEALSYGKAVIAGNTGGLADIINESGGGVLFEPGNMSELTESIKELVDNPSRADRLAKSATAYVNKLQWDNIALEYEKILKDQTK